MVKISMIMPVYNPEDYLASAIQCVLNQTMKDFELILVDDGSTDKSGEICDSFVKRDSRIVVIHQKNGGICRARNKGLEAANGEYIAFMDNDDEIAKTLFEDNLKLAVLHNADVVKFGNDSILMREQEVVHVDHCKYTQFKVVNAKELKDFYPEWRNYQLGGFVWNGLYKSKFLKSVHAAFNEEHKFGYEDVEFSMRIYDKMKTLVVNPNIYYFWKQRLSHSTSLKVNTDKLRSIEYVIPIETELLQRLGSNKSYADFCAGWWFKAFLCELFALNCHLSLKEKILLLRNFKNKFGQIPQSNYAPYDIRLYVFLYNLDMFLLLGGVRKCVTVLLGKENGLLHKIFR